MIQDFQEEVFKRSRAAWPEEGRAEVKWTAALRQWTANVGQGEGIST